MTTAPSFAPPLVCRTVPLLDPGPLVELMPDRGSLAWLRGDQGLVGWGCAARIETSGPDRFRDAEQARRGIMRRSVVRNHLGLPGTGPLAFGSFSFSPDSPTGGVLIVPEVLVGHRDGHWWLTVVSNGSLVPMTRPRPVAEPPGPGRVTFRDGALAAREWSERVATAVHQLGTDALPAQGRATKARPAKLEKVVLARDVIARAQRDIDPRTLLRRLTERYPGCWGFSVDGLVGATPEMLVRREKGLVTSRVLAGTIRRSGDESGDLTLAARLAHSSKDREEHEYAVRSVAEALTPHCSSINVPEAPYVLHLANVMHLATDVTGVLADETTSLGLAGALHPSAAVCGTPTAAAAALIDRIEGMDRGRYAGPVGWIDADGDGEWGIALRCGELDADNPRRMRLFAGCGIVAGSDPKAELAESEAKLMPMRQALTGS